MKPWYAWSDSVRGIPVTRYVASWYIAGGKQNYIQVRAWLESLFSDEPLNEDELYELAECIVNGKLELQEHAKAFIA